MYKTEFDMLYGAVRIDRLLPVGTFTNEAITVQLSRDELEDIKQGLIDRIENHGYKVYLNDIMCYWLGNSAAGFMNEGDKMVCVSDSVCIHAQIIILRHELQHVICCEDKCRCWTNTGICMREPHACASQLVFANSTHDEFLMAFAGNSQVAYVPIAEEHHALYQKLYTVAERVYNQYGSVCNCGHTGTGYELRANLLNSWSNNFIGFSM